MSHRDTLKTLITELGLTQKETAQRLSEVTQRPVSERAVRSWLADPEKPSARACPDWVIALLSDVHQTEIG
jgi:hypothetical protein